MTPNPSESDLAAAVPGSAEYFKRLRWSNDHALGLGDIRLTVAQQDEITAALASAKRDTDRLRICVERFTMNKFEDMPESLPEAREYIDCLMAVQSAMITAMSKEPPL